MVNIHFDKAFKLYKNTHPKTAITMFDKEAVLSFVKQFIPSLITTKEEFFKVLDMF